MEIFDQVFIARGQLPPPNPVLDKQLPSSLSTYFVGPIKNQTYGIFRLNIFYQKRGPRVQYL